MRFVKLCVKTRIEKAGVCKKGCGDSVSPQPVSICNLEFFYCVSSK